MTKYSGQLHKMAVRGTDPIEYTFVLQDCTDLPVANDFLGKTLRLKFTGKISCIGCGREVKKSLQQGYCYPCTQRLAACDMCVLKPENCHYDLGTCREPNWGLAHCFVPHIVYLANSSGVKVGVTRETQLPTRWIDQGAVQALPILRVQSRHQAGLLEVAFAKRVADKTDWRKMLRGANNEIDLITQRDTLFSELASTIQAISGKFPFGNIEILTSEKVHTINYPVITYPEKITSLNFDTTSEVGGVLQGIKGQYLMFDTGVINLRKFTGYDVALLI